MDGDDDAVGIDARPIRPPSAHRDEGDLKPSSAQFLVSESHLKSVAKKK